MEQKLRILHLADSSTDAALIHETIQEQGVRCEVKLVSSREEFHAALGASGLDLVLCDYGIPGYTGLDALKVVRQVDPDLPFILLSGTIGEEQAVESLKLGATDYILKDHLHRLGPAILRAVQESEEREKRRRADEALRLNEERLSCVLRATNDAVWDWEIQKNTIWWNHGLQVLFGYVPIGRRFDLAWWEDCVHPDDRQRVIELRRSALESNRQTWGDEYRFRCSDDSYAVVLDRGYIMRNEFGVAFRMIGSMMDITERKRAEEKIQWQAQLLDQTHDAIFVRALDQRIEFWNAGAERLYGWTAAEALGKRTDELFYRDASQLEARQAVFGKGEWTGELTHLTKAGQQVVVASRRTLLRDPDGNPAGILSINTDISEQKKLEVQFLQAQRLECLGSLAGGIAHDLNNMLAPIFMASDILRGGLKNEEDEKMLDLISTSARRGADLIKQILAFSKGLTSGVATFDARHIVDDVEKVLRPTFPRGITIENRCPAGLLQVEGDPTQFHQVLMNLCINARDAMPNGGVLTIRGGLREGEDGEGKPLVWVQVQDTGSGIPEHILPKIFEPFFTTKTPEKGTGLGLATVKKILAAHGGRVEVSSKAGEGTVFTCYLPASKKAGGTLNSDTVNLPRGRGEKVLVVDDEAALREILKATLESYGYEAIVAANGLEALNLAATGGPRIVLTDLNMPGLPGQEVARRIHRTQPDAVFVLMTGVLEPGALDAIEDLAKIILQKPFSTAALLAALRKATELPSSVQAGD